MDEGNHWFFDYVCPCGLWFFCPQKVLARPGRSGGNRNGGLYRLLDGVVRAGLLYYLSLHEDAQKDTGGGKSAGVRGIAVVIGMENQSEDITIRIRLGAEEAAVLNPPGLERERFGSRRIFRVQVLAVFILAVGLFVAFNRFPDDGRVALIPGLAAVGVLGIAFFLVSYLPGMRRSFADKEQSLKEAYSGIWEVTAGREGLVAQYGKRMDLIVWQRIEKAESDGVCLYLAIRGQDPLILPRKRVLEGDYERFVKAVQERTGRSKN